VVGIIRRGRWPHRPVRGQHILLQDVLAALGVPVATSSFERARHLMAQPLVRAYLFALTALSLFHWAHRFRYYVLDFGLMGARGPIALLCYGCAFAGTVGAARTALRRPKRTAT
jgi:fumarate reductase subunit D